MNRKTLALILLAGFLIVGSVGASCVSIVTLHDSQGKLVSGDVYAKCEKANKERTLHFVHGKGVVQSFGGPFDSCESFCENLFIRVSSSDGAIVEKAGFYPMNSSNQEGWDNESRRFYLDFLLDGKKDKKDFEKSYSGSSVPVPKGVLDKGVFKSDEEAGLKNKKESNERKGDNEEKISTRNFSLFLAVLLTIFLLIGFVKFRKKLKVYKGWMFKNKKEVDDGKLKN